jgi:hypothetical protein
MPAMKFWNGSSWVTLPAAGPKGDQGIQGGQVYSVPVGDGSALAYTITHNLNTRGVTVTVYRTAAPYDEILCDVEHTDNNTVTVRFGAAPTVGQYTVVCAAPGTQSAINATMDGLHYVGAPGEPAFQNSWVAYDVNNAPRFRKSPDGKVRLAGLIKSGASGTVAFTLPAGYRPAGSESVTFPVVAGAPALGYIQVAPSGAVTPVNLTGNVTTYCYLDGIEFDTESVSQVVSLAAVPMDPWHNVGNPGEPAFGTGSSNYGGANDMLVGFRKYPDGRVRLRGVANAPAAAASIIFTLPVGYRPQGYARFTCYDLSTGTPIQCYVSSDGTVRKVGTSGTSIIDLAPIEFDTESVASYATGAVPVAGIFGRWGATNTGVAAPVQLNFGNPANRHILNSAAQAYLVEHSDNASIKVLKAGIYRVTAQLLTTSSVANQRQDANLRKNNGIVCESVGYTQGAAVASYVRHAMTHIDNFAVNDLIAVWIGSGSSGYSTYADPSPYIYTNLHVEYLGPIA